MPNPSDDMNNLFRLIAFAALKEKDMNDMKLKTGKIEDKAVGAYKTIEEGVVKGYKAVEDAVVGTYQKIEDKFVKKFIKIMGIAALMTGITTGAMAQEQKAMRNPEVRKEAAQKRIDEAKGNR